MNYWKESKDNIYVAAHRGWCLEYPENTMEAFRAAAELHVDQIETDIRITKDGELVLIHDAAVDRTTDGTGLVIDKTLEELRALDAGGYKGEKFKGCKIPTFLEFMEYVKDLPEMTLDLELKEYPTPGHEEVAYSVCDRVLKIVDDYGFTDRVVINSWSAPLNEYIFKKYGKKYRQHVYFPVTKHRGDVEVDPYTYAFCACMFGENEYIASPEAFAWMADKGVEPWAGAGVKDEESVDRAIACGATLITCNNPDVILALLRKRGKHR